MAELERIPFDFSGDGCLEAAGRLEDILLSGHWSDRSLNYEDERTKLLLRLLQIGGIAVFKREYTQKEDTQEIRRYANEFNMFMNKRHVSQTLLDIAGIFFDYEYDSKKTLNNALFFPEQKAYVRCGGLSPGKLLELLEQDGCEAVMLFSDYCSDSGDAFYAFMLAMPKDIFLNALNEMQDQIDKTLIEAQKKVNERFGHIIPTLDNFTDTE